MERLTAAGISAAHAKAEAEALREVLEVNLKDLTTKQDLRELKLEMDHKFERELAPVRADLLLVKWMLGLVLGGILASPSSSGWTGWSTWYAGPKAPKVLKAPMRFGAGKLTC